jgi:protein-disulfide isomerase
LARALETGEFAELVKKDFSGGVRSGVNGTPFFFINGSGTTPTASWTR